MKAFHILNFLLLAVGSIFSQSFYDQNTIQKIEIFFSQADWDYQMDTAKAGKEGYVMAQLVKVNGESFDSVGVKYKGNSSFNPARLKNPLHIELNTYKEQSYQDFVDIKLGNNYADPSMIREVLGYDLLGNYMDCPRSNFAQVYINGAYYGLYSNTESIGKKFYREHFFTDDNTAFKCNPVVAPGTAAKCNLKYITSDSSSYYNYYELKSDAGWNDLLKLCDTVTNYTSAIERNLDMDRVLWMLAYNSAMVNLDSYTGAFCQNYYLYKDGTKRFNPVVWDLNMCFAGFPFVGSGTVSLGGASITQLQQLSLSIHATDPHWPLINKVMQDPVSKRMYAAHVKTIMNEMIASGTYTTKAVQLQALIDSTVQSDTVKLYTYAQFQNGLTANVSVGSYSVPGIQNFMTARNNYLQSQPEFTLTAPTITNVSVSPVNPAIGSQASITASITNASSCFLSYRNLNTQSFTKVSMFDDGAHNDGAAADNVYGAQFILSGNNTQYYIYAENNNAGIFSPQRAEHEYHQINIFPNPLPGQVTINEFLADNTEDVTNEFHLHEDWIELYNNSNSTLSLANYYLSNEFDTKAKFAFPHNTIIQPHSFLIVWADDIGLAGEQLHANFKLDKDGDKIILSNGLRTVLDSVRFRNQTKDISEARCPDGTGPFVSFLKYPTYGMSNCVVGMEEQVLTKDPIKLFPNPANTYFYIENYSEEDAVIEIFNLTGQMLMKLPLQDKILIDTGNWNDGLYLVKYGSQTKKLIIQH